MRPWAPGRPGRGHRRVTIVRRAASGTVVPAGPKSTAALPRRTAVLPRRTAGDQGRAGHRPGGGGGRETAGGTQRAGCAPWARTGVPRGFPVRRRGAYGAPRPAGHGAALPRPLPGPSPGRAPVSGPGRGREQHAYTVEMLGISSGGTSPATGRELKIVRSHDVIAFPGHFFQVADFGNPHSSASDRRHAPGSRCAGPRIRPCRSEHAPPAVSVHPAPAEGGAAHAYHRQNKIPPP